MANYEESRDDDKIDNEDSIDIGLSKTVCVDDKNANIENEKCECGCKMI